MSYIKVLEFIKFLSCLHEAGIQNLLILSDRMGPAFGGNDFYWISASAGMTKCGLKIFYISISYKFLLNFSKDLKRRD